MAEQCADCRNLERALQSRDVIATAKGLVMARLGISDDDAFHVLAQLSQNSNTPVRQIAAELVAEHVEAVSQGR